MLRPQFWFDPVMNSPRRSYKLCSLSNFLQSLNNPTSVSCNRYGYVNHDAVQAAVVVGLSCKRSCPTLPMIRQVEQERAFEAIHGDLFQALLPKHIAGFDRRREWLSDDERSCEKGRDESQKSLHSFVAWFSLRDCFSNHAYSSLSARAEPLMACS